MPEDSHHLPRRYSGGLVFLSAKVSWRASFAKQPCSQNCAPLRSRIDAGEKLTYRRMKYCFAGECGFKAGSSFETLVARSSSSSVSTQKIIHLLLGDSGALAIRLEIIFQLVNRHVKAICPKMRATNGVTLTARLGERWKSSKTAKLAAAAISVGAGIQQFITLLLCNKIVVASKPATGNNSALSSVPPERSSIQALRFFFRGRRSSEPLPRYDL